MAVNGPDREPLVFVNASDGGMTAAMADTLIEAAKINDVDLPAWLNRVRAGIADRKITRLDGLHPRRYDRPAAQNARGSARQRHCRTVTMDKRLIAELTRAPLSC
ncbi:MAG: hypothetical protein JKP98_03455 [Rhodobacteraceae bacterium]|nr:hypothetical protein [Paracoccaceae bacterium]